MKFPSELVPDDATRAGRMLEAGDVRVTVTDLESGDHITVRYKAMLDNRPGDSGRAIPENDRNWVRVPLERATHVFIEVPSASGDFPDKIGTFYPRTSRFFADRDADPQRVEAAARAAAWLNGGRLFIDEDSIDGFRYQEESHCGVCGRVLTDPESIDKGIGPECLRQATGSHHQVKQREGRGTRGDEKKLVRDLLTDIGALSDTAQDRIYEELELLRSQRRQSTRQ